MAKVGRSYKGLESHDSKPFLLAKAVEEDVSMKLSILDRQALTEALAKP